MQLANIAAGIVVGKVGHRAGPRSTNSSPPSARRSRCTPRTKVVTRDQLAQRVALWKANSERVVFANGCFDLLHIGHITLLEQARRIGDRLIVAINSDVSVGCLKWPIAAHSSARPSVPASSPPSPPSMPW